MKFGYKAKAIFCPLTLEKDYATIAQTKGKNFGGHEKKPRDKILFRILPRGLIIKEEPAKTLLHLQKSSTGYHLVTRMLIIRTPFISQETVFASLFE